MHRVLGRWSVLVAAVVLAGAAVGLARASVEELSQNRARAVPASPPSSAPLSGLLGRAGWDCAPERAAAASTADHAELPNDPPR